MVGRKINAQSFPTAQNSPQKGASAVSGSRTPFVVYATLFLLHSGTILAYFGLLVYALHVQAISTHSCSGVHTLNTHAIFLCLTGLSGACRLLSVPWFIALFSKRAVQFCRVDCYCFTPTHINHLFPPPAFQSMHSCRDLLATTS